MAQIPKHQHPSLQAEQSTAEEQDQNPASSQQTTITSTTDQQTKKTAQSRAAGRFDRTSTQRSSKVLVTYPLAPGLKDTAKPLQVAVKLHQPSKVFKTKCQAELKLLLDAIKTDFHEEIKTLHQEELYADFFIKIGDEDLKKPIHKCLIAARAFKFFSALKAFKYSPDSNPEKDIFVYEFQTSNQTTSTSNDKLRQAEDQTELEKAKAREDQLREALEVVNCNLPKNLINPELLLNFFRRTYLDQDLTEEESHLNQLTIGWIKANKPELIKQQPDRKHSPDHRESFRTIQPDFEQLSIADTNSANMSPNEQSSSEMAKSSGQTDNDEAADSSQAASSRADNNEPVSLLTRTETFEMISRANPDKAVHDPSSSEGGCIGKNDEDEDEDKDRSILSGDVNESESSEPYAPVTRTGLKPKKFTTPVGMKSASKRIPSTTSSSTKKTADGTKASPAAVARSGSINAKTTVASLAATNTKRSNEISGANSDSSTATTSTPPIAAARTKVTPSSSTTTTPAKPKQTIITRAHPISLERSQSPATKGSTKNFIAANKKLISQMERKLPPPVSPHNDQHGNNDDSENEVSDASLLALTESLTTDTLAAQVDKFSLISYSKLAEALSRMLIGEILTDTVVLVQHNKQVNAHRCILAARSAYLNDQISKQCLPSLTAETSSAAAAAATKQLIKIDLTEYSYPVVYFSLMHIYSGIVKVPEDVELEDLTKLSHLLHVGTLRQVCEHNLRMNYCHYFHKPCNVCCIGVLKTLPLAWRYDLTELYSKCLQWIGSHFAQIFCLEEFANLKPNDLIEECYKETLCQLTPDNVIQKTIECQKLLKSLPRVKWTESIICLVGRQLEDFCHYVASNYEKILQSESFLNLGKSCWECEVLEENLLAAMNHLRPDSGCRTLIQLDKIECSMESYLNEPRNVSETFVSLVSKMRKYCERYLLKDAAAVVHCNSWRQMNPALQKRIKDQALLATDFEEPTKHLASKPKLPSMARHQQQSSRLTPSPQPNNSTNSVNNSGSDTRSPSNRSTPDSRLRSPNTTYLPPPKNKPATARHVKVLK